MRARLLNFLCSTVLLLIFIQPAVLLGSNGMNMIGFGARSTAMGGADLAIISEPAAMNINPAGISRLQRATLSFGLSPVWPLISHTDRFGNDAYEELDHVPMPYAAYVHPVGNLSVGVGVFGQGRLGAEYTDMTTSFNALKNSGNLPPDFFVGNIIPFDDEMRTTLMHMKLTPSLSWRLSDNLAVGASLNVSYVRASMKFFPETSILADLDFSGIKGDSQRDVFSGMEVDGVAGFGYGFRTGFQYALGNLFIGGAYLSETKLNPDGGKMELNLTAQGLGIVDYNAFTEGLIWPQQAGVGVAYQLTRRILLASDVDWINWSNAFKTLEIHLDNPSFDRALPSRVIPFLMDWEDQLVVAVGMELMLVPNLVGRLGFNHGKSPVPDNRLRPIFPAIAENHITGGLGWTINNWTFDMSIEYALEVKQSNNATEFMVNPFGPGSTEILSQTAAHFSVYRSF